MCRLTAIRQPTSRKLHTWSQSPPTIFGTRPARTSTPAPAATRTGPPRTTPNRPCGTWSSFPDFPGRRRCAHFAPPLDWSSRVCAPGRTGTHDPLLRSKGRGSGVLTGDVAGRERPEYTRFPLLVAPRGHGCRRFEHYMLRVLFHAGGVSWPIRPSPPRIRTPRSPERHRSSPTNTVYAPADPDAPVTAPVTPIVTPWPPPRSRPGDGRPQWA